MRKKKLFRIITLISIVWLVVSAFCFSAGFAHAAEEETKKKSCGGVETVIIECGDKESGIGHVLKIVINAMNIGVGVLAVIGITICGIQYLTAKDNEEQVKKAKRRLVEIVLGVVAYVLMSALLQFVTPGSTNPDDIPYFDPPDESYAGHYDPKDYEDDPIDDDDDDDNNGGGFTETKKCKAKTDREYITDKVSGGITGYYINIPEKATNKTPIVLYLAGGGEYHGYNKCALAGTTTAGQLTCESSMIGSTKYLFNSNDVITIIPTTSSAGTGNDPWLQNDRLTSLKSLVTGGMGVNDYLKSCGGVGNRDKHIMGMSWGAGGTWAMVDKHPTLFKSATPIAGSMYEYTYKYNASNYKNTRIIAISDNGYTSAMKTIVENIQAIGPKTNPILVGTPYDHDHITQRLDYAKIFGCILKKSCSNFGENTTILIH